MSKHPVRRITAEEYAALDEDQHYRTELVPRLVGFNDALDGEALLPGFSLPLACLFS